MTDDAGTYSDAIGSLIDQTKRLAKAEAEVTRLRAVVARVERLIDQWDGELGAQEDYQHSAAVRAVEACMRDLMDALGMCTCPWVDPSLWTTHYGATEPGSTREFDPDCPVHELPAPQPTPPDLADTRARADAEEAL